MQLQPTCNWKITERSCNPLATGKSLNIVATLLQLENLLQLEKISRNPLKTGKKLGCNPLATE
jgi:hypothetical protein